MTDETTPLDGPGPRGGPTWLDEPCPRWCTREHREADHPEDRYHQSEASVVPVIAEVSASGGPGRWRAIDLALRLGRHLRDPLVWCTIEATEATEPRFILTLDSVRLLDEQIRLQLRLHDVA